jgi:hypothetical protein
MRLGIGSGVVAIAAVVAATWATGRVSAAIERGDFRRTPHLAAALPWLTFFGILLGVIVVGALML